MIKTKDIYNDKIKYLKSHVLNDSINCLKDIANDINVIDNRVYMNTKNINDVHNAISNNINYDNNINCLLNTTVLGNDNYCVFL